MIVKRSKEFKKLFKKRIANNFKLVKKASERINIFIKNQSDPILKDHQLTGNKKKFRSFSITGDIRIIYYQISKNEVLFIDIGTHNQVY